MLIRFFRPLFLAAQFGSLIAAGPANAASDIDPSILKVRYLNSDRLVAGRGDSVYDLDFGPDGFLYVPCFRKNQILVLDQELVTVRSIENIQSPHGLAVGPDGSLYVATYRHGRVLKFDQNQAEIPDWDSELVSQKRIQHPVSIAVDASSNVYIADYGLNKIVKTDSSGKYVLSFETAGLAGFQPHGITTDGKRLFAADRGVKTIRVFSVDGSFAATWEPPAADFDPLAIRRIPPDLFAVANYADSRIYLFDAHGRSGGVLGVRGDKNGQLMAVTNLVSDERRILYIVEQDANRIQKIDFVRWTSQHERNT